MAPLAKELSGPPGRPGPTVHIAAVRLGSVQTFIDKQSMGAKDDIEQYRYIWHCNAIPQRP
jgi:hypothetical protein